MSLDLTALLAFDPTRHQGGMIVPRTHECLITARSGAPYRILISWPEGEAPAAGWPIVYLLGSDTFLLATEMLRYRAGGGTADSLRAGIIVGIGYPAENRRVFDYTPAALHGEPNPKHHGADAFLDFVLDDLRPAVENVLPVDRGAQTFAGHSLGGMLVLLALFRQPDAFQSYLASSPSVWWRDAQLLEMAKRFAAQDATADVPVARLWLSAGEYEQALSPAELAENGPDIEVARKQRDTRFMVDHNREIANALRTRSDLRVGFRYFANETHRTIVPVALLAGLCAALASEWMPDEATAWDEC
ncbi:alpha/beta hydrolase [Pigmentiphaga aceris]|uniref:Alpha/beta hydrolase n=1 Tax=Pigmentiphaga aceris TaxID=1940612 RepID=A0A5C0AT40_9BURK|nr:alpha/beta hydrolase-fold protein [Pigmentiphaga aceris]QEI05245.1 alpha/beta hydrolase [Pigmentiphaga aceris]